MERCVREYTIINSQPSIEALENLMATFFSTFGILKSIDDIFYYGVFFKSQNYMNFSFEFGEDYEFDIPSIILSECASDSDKLDYIEKIIKQIMRKEIRKPEWMKYIEMNMMCNEFGQAPSSFLRIEAIEEKYEKLAQKLIEFLYSPNLTITMV